MSGHDGARGNAAAINDSLRETIHLSGRSFRAPGRHRIDAAVDIHILLRRCAREIHGRDLFGRATAVAARLRGADPAVADDLAASGGIRAARAALAAIAPGHALDP